MNRLQLANPLLRMSWRTGMVAACLALAACASKPAGDISRIPAQLDEQTSKQGLFTQPLKWEKTATGCKGNCPTLKVDSLVFPGVPILTELVDHALVVLTGLGSDQPLPYLTVQEFEDHFWNTAAPRDEVLLSARTRYRNRSLTVLELNTWQYFTGAAHGISATQFLIWDNKQNKVLGVDDIFIPGQHANYLKILEQAHSQWQADAIQKTEMAPADYRRLWPFQPNDNLAFTDKGIVVKYNTYEISPYYMGQPEILLQYSDLRGILRPEFMPG